MELLFERALLPTGIARRVAVSVADGRLSTVTTGAPEGTGTPVSGLAVCGMPNLHSHAFQRGIAGLTELAGTAQDSFWGWREAMYRFVARLEPEDVTAIAAFAYLEMIECGYTSVAEFHYLHHQPDGRAYLDPHAMATAVRAAAQRVGVRLLLLPCLYQTSGFGQSTLLATQRRFVHDTDAFLRLFEQLRAQASALQTTGVALHSLRAVPRSALGEVIAAVPAGLPIHIHVAEQVREVDECLKFTRKRPIEYLMEVCPIDRHWCLVHATHASATELQAVARSEAVAGLCPTTEANLGDGIFPLDEFVAQGGHFGIGSDSQISIDPREELRAAEYALRLTRQRRGLVSDGIHSHCGTALYSLAASGGARALGIGTGALTANAVADLVVLDTDCGHFAGVPDEALLDAHIFAGRANAVRDVMVGGQWILRARRHPQRDHIVAAYRNAIERLLQ